MRKREALASVLREIRKRSEGRKAAQPVLDSLFPRQKDIALALLHGHRKAAVLTSRRAGKSWCLCSTMAAKCLASPESRCLYLALTRQNVKRFAWSTIKKLDREHGLKLDFHESDLVATFPNGSTIEFAGADNPRLPDRWLGSDFDIVAVDEAGSFDPLVLDYLLDEVLEQTLIDRLGCLALAGTPKEIEAGRFFDVTSGPAPTGWTVRKWSTGDNPHMRANWERQIAEKKAENPDIESDPAFVRDYLGRWCSDKGDKVYRYDPARNLCTSLPEGRKRWLAGLDMGWDDAMAMVLCCVVEHDSTLWVADCHAGGQMLLDRVASVLKDWEKKCQPFAVVADEGALGKALSRNLQARHGIPIFPAAKTDKRAAIAAMNTDMAAGKIRLMQDSTAPLAKELADLPRKKDPVTGRWQEHPAFPNDLCDALLYAWRHAHGWIEKPTAPRETKEQRLLRQMEERALKRKKERGRRRGRGA